MWTTITRSVSELASHVLPKTKDQNMTRVSRPHENAVTKRMMATRRPPVLRLGGVACSHAATRVRHTEAHRYEGRYRVDPRVVRCNAEVAQGEQVGPMPANSSVCAADAHVAAAHTRRARELTSRPA